MLSPHESLLVNQRRGLLGAVFGNPSPLPGILDVYDVKHRLPAAGAAVAHADRRCSATRAAGRRDGKTFYASSTGGQTLVAIDVSDPTDPRRIFEQYGVNYHGLRLSADGRRMYVANIGNVRRRRSPAAACGSSTSARSRTVPPTRRSRCSPT